jgi:hypothetical protein
MGPGGFRRGGDGIAATPPPPWWEVEAKAAEYRAMRAVALEHGLDPDKTPPEDIILLAKDNKGALLAAKEYEAAAKRAAYYAGLEADANQD